ncbi:class II aldolase/adducin family protein [Micromonospora profundi]|uniref:class II aldolase/adducin family protein n=1 Tax=Micromonospora profundi TaxID=1420889 RepID=UPI00365915ED
MDEAEEREGVASAVRQLRIEHLLDWTGGAVSQRLDNMRMVITPGGGARRRWEISANDLLVVDVLAPPSSVIPRPPIGTAIHSFIYREVPGVGAIVHTHAGAAYLASCFCDSSLGSLPPTAHLGEIPVLGLTLDDGRHDSTPTTQASWVEQVTIPQAAQHLTEWKTAISTRGVAFLDFGHGAYTAASSLGAAIIDLARLERACQLWLLKALGLTFPTVQPRPPSRN